MNLQSLASLWTKEYIKASVSRYTVQLLSSFLCFLFLSSLWLPPSFFSFLSLSLSLFLGSMPSPAVCSAPTVRAQGRPGSQLARHCGASRQAHGGPPAPASSFANMPRCGAWWLGLWCVCVCDGGGVRAGGGIKGGYSHWSCVNTECRGVFVAWGVGRGPYAAITGSL